MGKVLVTGAGGFIGSHLVEALVKEGHMVRALVRYGSTGSHGWLESLDQNILASVEVVLGDIRDANCVRSVMGQVHTAYHLAALIGIPYSYVCPDSYVDTNIKGTLNVLQAARDLDTSRVLVTSTSEVYGTAQYVPMDEKHPYQGQSPYSASKIGSDRMAEAYYKSFGTPVTIVRPFNTYGPRQSARAIIPTIISQLLAGKEEISLGSLTPTRDFNFVKDTAQGFIAIANSSLTIGEEVNIATQKEISMEELAKGLIAQINPKAKIITKAERVRPDKSEVMRLLGDHTKIKAMTDWAPSYTFEEGLAETIEWMKHYLGHYKTDLYNV